MTLPAQPDDRQYQYSYSSTSEKKLRDEFAMAALTGLLSGSHVIAVDSIEAVCVTSYNFADAMMKAREQTK